MNTHESYVSLTTAKMLKESGFDWKCIRYYQNDDETLYGPLVEQYKLVETNFNVAPVYMNQYSAPTLEVAQKWLREVKGIYVESVLCANRGTSGHSYGFSIAEVSADLSIVKILYPSTYFDEEETKGFKKYELSLEAGIKNALEMILGKGE